MGRKRSQSILLLAAVLTCCGAPVGSKEVARQKVVVTSAEVTLSGETAMLQAMEDSLDARIQQDVRMGMSTAEADSVERSVIASQEAVVRAAEENVKRQKEYLETLEVIGD